MTNLSTRFEPAEDGWFHLAPMGNFAHPSGARQVIDAEACGAMAGRFAEEARGANFPGLLVDFDHFSHDPAQASAAAGWVTALEPRADGLYGQVRWSDVGREALEGGRYRLVSPVWQRGECESWMAPAGPEGRMTEHLRPRRLDRVALTNDPNLPGMTPLTNRNVEFRSKKSEVKAGEAENLEVRTKKLGQGRQGEAENGEVRRKSVEMKAEDLRAGVLRGLGLAETADDEEILGALRGQGEELAGLRNRLGKLEEAEIEAELERFGAVITNREAVRGALRANREGTLAVLRAVRLPERSAPLHQPRLRRPELHLLSPVAAEGDAGSARRVANRARQLQAELKIGHHAAFRMAEEEG